jgi:hypothetical protein
LPPTPTELGSVVFLDKVGAIVKVWKGFPSPAQQQEVIEFARRSLRERKPK